MRKDNMEQYMELSLEDGCVHMISDKDQSLLEERLEEAKKTPGLIINLPIITPRQQEGLSGHQLRYFNCEELDRQYYDPPLPTIELIEIDYNGLINASPIRLPVIKSRLPSTDLCEQMPLDCFDPNTALKVSQIGSAIKGFGQLYELLEKHPSDTELKLFLRRSSERFQHYVDRELKKVETNDKNGENILLGNLPPLNPGKRTAAEMMERLQTLRLMAGMGSSTNTSEANSHRGSPATHRVTP